MPTLEPTVFIVDDDPAVRHSLMRLLGAAERRARAYASAEEYLSEYDRDAPGCLLLDVRMPGMSGLALQARLAAHPKHVPVIMITGHGDVPMAVAAMKAGALEFIEKPFDDDRLLRCVTAALERDQAMRERLARLLERRQRLNDLSPREREVLDGLARGETVEQIAVLLGISPKTVYMHRTHLMDKLGSDSLANLVRLKLEADGLGE